MRKNVIALSIAALVGGLGMAGSASADVLVDTSTVSPTDADFLIVTPGGVGHILMVPYFNTQGTNATLLNITNTDTTNGKALKVRFRGAANSDDVFDFQLFLSPGDVWTANIAGAASGASRMLTGDKSCTLPPSINQEFVLDRLPPSFTAAQKAAWTREGYIEILNMADVPPNAITSTGDAAATANALYTATKHVSGVAPCTTTAAGFAAFEALKTNPTTIEQAWAQGFRAPSGGVFANFIIVDTANSGSYSGEATAITAHQGSFLDPVTNLPNQGRGNIVFFPQTDANAPSPDLNTADPALRTGGFITPLMFDLPDLSTPYVSAPGLATAPILQAARLSNALATRFVRNEFFTDPTVSAVSDWTFVMPTRRYSIALNYNTSPATRYYTSLSSVGGYNYFTSANTSVSSNLICVDTGGLTIFDREETTKTTGFVISPGTSTTFRLCGEASVLSWNAGGVSAPSALGAAIARSDVAAPARDGWASISTPGAAGVGLPVIGTAFSRAAVPAGKFGIAWEHRYGR